MTAKSSLLCGSAAAVALTLAGCGSGRLSHDAYVTRADAVCRAYDAHVKLLTKPTSYDAVVAYVDKTLPYYVAAVSKLKRLRPAKADEAAVHGWLAHSGDVEAELKTLREAALNRDAARMNDASTAMQSASLASRQAAAALGLTDCAAP
ncbi:MAG TPA: hypothetical protein VHD91_09185 [Gaiellaceae bacterium]|nr:hypothetical protein [Gaiellaceae bacterium]